MAKNATRERILDTAEELFATQGISGTSLRALTRAADVNLAAVHYHFGSKEGLLDAVVGRRALPINEERLATLDRLETEAGGSPPSVEDILSAFLVPGVRQIQEMPEMSGRLSRLVARIDAQPPEITEPLYRKHFGEVGRRFLEVLQRSLPHLPKETVADRYRFTLGVLSFVFSGNFELDVIPGHPVSSLPLEDRLLQVIAFLSAGLAAPVFQPRAHPSTLREAQ